eukprot:m.38227 g.38227  ORF g.38227 m.38227 type:complete len:91 (+) comp6787_c0_seq1:1919-2191(+)
MKVNPHVVPFIRYKSIFSANAFQWLKGELVYRLRQLQVVGFKRHNITNLITVLNQPYAGDITITPKFTTEDYMRYVGLGGGRSCSLNAPQ